MLFFSILYRETVLFCMLVCICIQFHYGVIVTGCIFGFETLSRVIRDGCSLIIVNLHCRWAHSAFMGIAILWMDSGHFHGYYQMMFI